MVFAVAVAAAILLAVGFVMQQHEAAQIPHGRIRPDLLLTLARRPAWLVGVATMAGGQLLGAAALAMGSLIVVEPLLAANVLFALILGAFTSQQRLAAGDWLGSLLLISGLVVFLVGGSPSEAVNGGHLSTRTWLVAGGCLLAAVVILLTLASGRDDRTRAALLATSAGIFFGAQDFLTQRTVNQLTLGVGAALVSWKPWVLIALAVVGLTFSQNAFGLADLSASLPPATLAEPVTGIALAEGTFGQSLSRGVGALTCTAAGLALMITGVMALTRSPLVVDPHARSHRAVRGRKPAAWKLLHRTARNAPGRQGRRPRTGSSDRRR
jgi:drug/metabolite transporter (DMT)-like permease